MRFQKFLLLSTALITLAPVSAFSASVENAGYISNSNKYSRAAGVSADGSTLIAYSYDGTNDKAIKWTSSGGLVSLGTLGGNYSYAAGANSNGTIIVGESSDSASDTKAFIWTAGSGMTNLGALAGGTYSAAFGISNNGTTVVGESEDSGSWIRAFRWTQAGGMQNLGVLSGGTFSSAKAVNADGSVVVGRAENNIGNNVAFIWTAGGGMQSLGSLVGASGTSKANDVSDDGTVVVGSSQAATGERAFRWTQAGGMVSLGTLQGTISVASATNSDGSVVVGYSTYDAGNAQFKAFRWTQATGMQNIETLLTNAGVNLSGIGFEEAMGVDATGNIIAISGRDSNISGNPRSAFLVNLGGNAGVITPGELQKTLSSTLVAAQQSQATMNTHLGQSLFAASTAIGSIKTSQSNISPSAGDEEGFFKSLFSRNWSGYMVGSFGAGQDNDFDNNTLNGTAGLLLGVDKNFVVGGGLLSGHSRSDTDRGGDSQLDSNGASLLASYQHESGLNIYGSLFAAKLDIDLKRNYMNGAGLSTSTAETEGMGYGAVLHTGFDLPTSYGFMVTPYAELEASRTKIDGYKEIGGAFPATVSKSTSDQITSRLGTKLSYPLSDKLVLSGTAAYAHRLKQGNNSVTASTTGFSGAIGAAEGDKNWAETSVAVDWQATESTRLTTNLSGRSGRVSEPAVSATFGLKTDF